MDEQFISNSKISFVTKLAKFLDIEFSNDVEHIKQSGKTYISWNPTARTPDDTIWQYFKQHSLPAVFVERGALPNTVMLDRNGFLADSSSYDETNWNHPMSSADEVVIDNYINHLRTSDDTLELQGTHPVDFELRKYLKQGNKEIVFVPLQLNTDTVIQRWGGWVKDIHNFQRIVETLARKYPEKCFLVKNHPITKNNRMRPSSNIVVADSFHYKSCLACADKVLVINSGVGLQSMVWGVPAIIVGTAFYQFPGINYHATTQAQVCNLLEQKLTVDLDKMKRFMFFLTNVFYSDCVLTKLEKSRHRNSTDNVEYTNIRIFKGLEQ